MTQDEIIEMAREAGIMSSVLNHWPLELKKFAKLVAAKEREACAKALESISNAPDMQAYANIVRLREQA
jgi:hypothetical protein